LTAATLLQGAGIVLSGLAILCWVGAVARRLHRFVRQRSLGRRNWTRFAVLGGGGIALTTFALWTIPWPGAVSAPAIVRYAPQTVVRTGSDGFVEEIHVQGGQRVAEGQLLVVMANEELEHELFDLEVAIEKSRLTRRVFQRQGELAKAQAEADELSALERQYDEKKEEVASLQVRAPRAGNVVRRDLESLLGTYLEKGSDLLSIGDGASKELRLSIAQYDIVAFRGRVDHTLRAHVHGTTVLTANLRKIEPQASVAPRDVSLCAPYGGPLPVRQLDGESAPMGRSGLELLSPRFTGVMPLDPAQSRRVFAGQRTRVALRPSESVGEHLHHLIVDWVDSKLQRREGRQ
jgi:putative peptide zinc metalloprotease protein